MKIKSVRVETNVDREKRRSKIVYDDIDHWWKRMTMRTWWAKTGMTHRTGRGTRISRTECDGHNCGKL